jgi:ApeA N-terminal domain 1
MNAREYAGVWWLPNIPDNKVSGTLSFSDEEGILLRLIGSFEE